MTSSNKSYSKKTDGQFLALAMFHDIPHKRPVINLLPTYYPPTRRQAIIWKNLLTHICVTWPQWVTSASLPICGPKTNVSSSLYHKIVKISTFVYFIGNFEVGTTLTEEYKYGYIWSNNDSLYQIAYSVFYSPNVLPFYCIHFATFLRVA